MPNSPLPTNPNKKENQMTNPIAAARREYDNADEAFRSNPTDANIATYEAARKAFLAAEAEAGLSSNAAVDEEDEDERPFPDSDEAIRALQDVADAVDEMEAECHRLRAELKTALAERDAARVEVCVSLNGNMKQAHEYAISRGWDCFKEESK